MPDAERDDQPSPADEQKNSEGAGGDQKDDDQKGKGGGQGNDGAAPPPKKPIWPWIVVGAVVIVFVAVALWLIFRPQSDAETNDARVEVHYSSIAPQVAGRVVGVHVDDNQAVRAGQLLFTIDDRPYRTTLDQALATLASDQALARQADATVGRQPALIAQAAAGVEQGRAALIVSGPRADRYRRLSLTGAGSVEQRQQADAQLRADQAVLAQSQANLRSSELQLPELRAQADAARARLDADRAQIAQARLNLSYTRVYAPFAGTVDQRTVQVGNYVTPGTPAMTLVPLDAVYVTANYREVALRHMRPGQHARIHVDAYDVWLDGVVESLPAGTGTNYSAVQPTNATGNFTKIVQRLPVRIAVARGQPLARLLRVGMSVETEVETELHDVVADQRQSDERVTAEPLSQPLASSVSAPPSPAPRPDDRPGAPAR